MSYTLFLRTLKKEAARAMRTWFPSGCVERINGDSKPFFQSEDEPRGIDDEALRCPLENLRHSANRTSDKTLCLRPLAPTASEAAET